MNEKRQELIRLCAERPLSLREFVGATGDSVTTVRHRLYDLEKMGAVKRINLNDRDSVFAYQAVPGWRKKKATPDLTTYKSIGICVMGVWM